MKSVFIKSLLTLFPAIIIFLGAASVYSHGFVATIGIPISIGLAALFFVFTWFPDEDAVEVLKKIDPITKIISSDFIKEKFPGAKTSSAYITLFCAWFFIGFFYPLSSDENINWQLKWRTYGHEKSIGNATLPGSQNASFCGKSLIDSKKWPEKSTLFDWNITDGSHRCPALYPLGGIEIRNAYGDDYNDSMRYAFWLASMSNKGSTEFPVVLKGQCSGACIPVIAAAKTKSICEESSITLTSFNTSKEKRLPSKTIADYKDRLSSYGIDPVVHDIQTHLAYGETYLVQGDEIIELGFSEKLTECE